MLTFDAIFCVFAKPAIAGQAKTRLAPVLGEREAARLASAFFTDTWRSVATRPGTAAVLACTGPPTGLQVNACGETWFQGPGDLGARIERVLRRALARSRWAVALGADSPGMPPDRLDALLAARATHDAAIVRADDGGFVALAVSRCPEGLLHGVTWSAATTADEVVARLVDAGFTVAEVPGWWDVDTPADLLRLQVWLAEDPDRAPVTAATLGLRTPP